MNNDKTVVGLCDLKRRTAINSFNFARQGGFNRSFAPSFASEIPGGLVYAK
ncbi:hypothetical protein J6O48_12275 [bacterium]|nr:hypothetical protein [bacterium]